MIKIASIITSARIILLPTVLIHESEKALLFGQIFEIEFWSIYKFWSPLHPKITFLVFSLRMRVSVCVSVPVICITQKQFMSRNFKFGILHLYHILMLLENFYEDWTNSLSTEASKKFESISSHRRNFL